MADTAELPSDMLRLAERIVDRMIPAEPDLSPDGRSIVYTLTTASQREEHPVSALWLAPADGAQPARQLTAGRAEDHLPKWSPDGAQIAFLSDRATRGVAQLYALPLAGGEAHPLTPDTNKKSVESYVWSPDGQWIVLTSADEPTPDDERRERERDDANVWGERLPFARLRLLSLATGALTTLLSKDRHIGEPVWSADGSRIAYFSYATPALESHERDVALECVTLRWNEETSPVADEPHAIATGLAYVGNLGWSRDGSLLFFSGPATPGAAQSSAAIYTVPAQSGIPRRIAFGETSCTGGVMRPHGAEWATVEEDAGLATRLRWLNLADGAHTPLLDDGMPDYDLDAWTIRALPDGGSAVACIKSTSWEPQEVWAGSHDGLGSITSLRRLTTHGQEFADYTWGREEVFSWLAPDGWELDGLIVYPPDWRPNQEPRPMVTLVHGGPYWRWRPGFHLGWGGWAQWLALAGYLVLLPNPRGGQGHGERFAAAARGDVGGDDYKDIMAAVDAAIALGLADPDRLGIGGWSQGGFMSAWAVTQTQRFKAAVMGAGISDWGMMTLTSDMPTFEQMLGGSSPWDARPDNPGPRRHESHSPISFAFDVATPTLILHGEKDERVPVSQAIGFHRALRYFGAPTELVIYPREPHGIRERAHQLDVLRRVRLWYDRWLRG